MTFLEKTQIRRDIADAFAFLRYLLKHPASLRKIRNDSEVRILPSQSQALQPSRKTAKVQYFVAETKFHDLPRHP